MRTVAIINQKGGCGKTTTSINLAACLARLGQKTLLVDMDPQGHCGTGLAVPRSRSSGRSTTPCSTRPTPATAASPRCPTSSGRSRPTSTSAPSNIRLAAFEQVFAGRPGREDRLGNALASAQDNYKWCVIDCPPSVGLITFNALKACDEVIVPVETGYFSLHGLTKMMETLDMLRERTGKDITVRVLPTLYDTRTKLAREVLSELRAKFKNHLMTSTVNFNTKLKEAASFGQPITEYDPGSKGYKDFANLARELMGARPAEPEIAPDKMSRPQELVQRARALAQLANYQFGKNAVPTIPAAPSAGQIPAVQMPAAQPAAAAAVAPPVTASASLFNPGGVQRIAAVAPGRRPGPVRDGRRHHRRGRPSRAAGPHDRAEAGRLLRRQATGDGVVFSAPFDQARQVLIAGDFNNWTPASTPMFHQPGTGWSMKLPLSPGRYRYRFVVDGKWQTTRTTTWSRRTSSAR
jgi:chromosome partitioning protein